MTIEQAIKAFEHYLDCSRRRKSVYLPEEAVEVAIEAMKNILLITGKLDHDMLYGYREVL